MAAAVTADGTNFGRPVRCFEDIPMQPRAYHSVPYSYHQKNKLSGSTLDTNPQAYESMRGGGIPTNTPHNGKRFSMHREGSDSQHALVAGAARFAGFGRAEGKGLYQTVSSGETSLQEPTLPRLDTRY